MPGPDFGWINELNPLGPPADALNNTPLNAADLEDFKDFIETYAEGYAVGQITSALNARISSATDLGGGPPYSTTVAPSQSAVQAWVASHSSPGGGGAFTNVQDNPTIFAGMGGSTSLTSALQTIINDAASATTGKTVYFPKGVYGIGNGPSAGVNNASEPIFWGIQLPSNTHLLLHPLAELRGLGNRMQAIISTQDSGGIGGGDGTGNDNITIDGGDFNGNSTVQNGIIRIMGGAGDPNKCKNIVVRNAHIHDCNGQGLKFKDCQNVKAHNNRVHNNNQDGIMCFGEVKDVIFSNNHSYNNGDDDIAVGNSFRSIVTGNICGEEAGGTGSGGNITARAGNNIVISGNTCFGSQGTSIYLSNEWAAGDNGLYNVIVVGNTVARSGMTGSFAGNGIQVNCADQLGWDQTGTIKRIIIANNTVQNTKGTGIGVVPHSNVPGDSISDLTIKGNIVYWDYPLLPVVDSASRGIRFNYASGGNVADALVDGNRVMNSPNIGYDLGGAGTKRIKVLNNIMRRNNQLAFAGIVVDNAVSAQIVGNSSYDLQGTNKQTVGISAVGAIGTVMITNNDTVSGAANTTRIAADVAADVYTGTADFFHMTGNPGVLEIIKDNLQPNFTITGMTTDHSLNPATDTLPQVANVLATLIDDLGKNAG